MGEVIRADFGQGASSVVEIEAFAASREVFEQVLVFASGEQAAGLSHGEMETQLQERMRELGRRVYQDWLDQQCEAEQRESVVDADGVQRRVVERGHDRGLATVFGPVTHKRMAYRRQGLANRYPADGQLNMPAERHSHGVRRMAVELGSAGCV